MHYVTWKAKPINEAEYVTPDVFLKDLGISYQIISSLPGSIENWTVLAAVSSLPNLEGFSIAEKTEEEAKQFIMDNFSPSEDSNLTAEQLATLLIDSIILEEV